MQFFYVDYSTNLLLRCSVMLSHPLMWVQNFTEILWIYLQVGLSDIVHSVLSFIHSFLPHIFSSEYLFASRRKIIPEQIMIEWPPTLSAVMLNLKGGWQWMGGRPRKTWFGTRYILSPPQNLTSYTVIYSWLFKCLDQIGSTKLL